MKYVRHAETGGVFGLEFEKLAHFTTLASAQFNANVFTAEDKITEVNTEEFQSLLLGCGIPFQHPDRLANFNRGGTWSRAHDNADQLAANQVLLNKLVKKLGA